MDARELRIGNIVKHEHRGGDYTYINSRDIQNIEDQTDFGKQFSPISITEEWLLKFGFENKNEIIIDSFGRFYLLRCQDVQIKYVHQLQNLYFALTGIELTIK